MNAIRGRMGLGSLEPIAALLAVLVILSPPVLASHEDSVLVFQGIEENANDYERNETGGYVAAPVEEGAPAPSASEQGPRTPLTIPGSPEIEQFPGPSLGFDVLLDRPDNAMRYAHRGPLGYDRVAPFGQGPMFSSGPDVPPPALGDWNVVGPGNYVNDTVVLLNGNLAITTGSLTLDNVTLIMNCTTDGQYGIHIGAGGSLTALRSNLTAFNGAYHYRFVSSGSLTMTGTNVSEVWGNSNAADIYGGVALRSGAVITGCNFSNGSGSGIGTYDTAAPTIMNCNFTNHPRQGIACFNNSAPMVSGCYFSYCYNGLGGSNSSAPVVSGCRAWNCSNTGFLSTANARMSLQNSSASGCAFGAGAALDAVLNITSGNFSNNLGGGLGAFNSSLVNASDCITMNNYGFGAYANNSSTMKLKCCTSSRNSRGFCAIEKSKVDWYMCNASQNSWTGFSLLNSTSGRVSWCKAFDQNAVGFAVYTSGLAPVENCTANNVSVGFLTSIGDTFTSANFTDCTVYVGMGDGFSAGGFTTVGYLRCRTVAVNYVGFNTGTGSVSYLRDCTSIASYRYGMLVDYAAIAYLEHCDINASVSNGLEMRSTGFVVASNCTLDANWIGISMSGSATGRFNNCTVRNSCVHGIYLTESASGTFEDCDSLDNAGGSGFHLFNNASSTFSRCRASGNSGFGFSAIMGTKGLVSGCSFNNNKIGGLDIERETGLVIEDCTAYGNWQFSAAFKNNVRPTVNRCNFYASLGAGLSISDYSAPVFSNCSVSNSKFDGIDVMHYASPVFRNCYVTGNNGYGFSLFSTSTPTLVNCEASTNTLSGVRVAQSSQPTLERLTLTGNAAENLRMESARPVLLANSTLKGAPIDVIGLGNSSISLLNCNVDGSRLIASQDAVISVQWYVKLIVLDSMDRPCGGATVRGTGSNGSSIVPLTVNSTGTADYLVVNDFTQRGPNRISHNPYNMNLSLGVETNVSGPLYFIRSSTRTLFLDFAPVIAPLPEVPVTEDVETAFDLAPYLSDPDGPAEALAITVDTDLATVDGMRILFNCSSVIDALRLNVTVSDGLKNVTAPLRVTVSPVNDRPFLLKQLPDQSATEDIPLVINLTEYFSDEENGTNLAFNCSDARFAIDQENGKASWTPASNDTDIERVVITASDGELSVYSNAFRVVVIQVNEPPFYKGGLKGGTVPEHGNWSVDLDDYFGDEDTPGQLSYTCSNIAVTIHPVTHRATWAPTGEVPVTITISFTALDGMDRNLSAVSESIELNYAPENDAPVYLGGLTDARIDLGQEWNISLERYFTDEETQYLRFSCNFQTVKIVAFNATIHYAVWKPSRMSSNLTKVVLRAYDGLTWTNSTPFNLSVYVPPENKPVTFFTVTERVPVYIWALLPAGIIGGVVAYYMWRRVRYGRYEVEQAFLVYDDGRLMAHRAKGGEKAGNEELVGGMLTALKSFIKDSIKQVKDSDLDEVKYGDLKIAIERGNRIYLALFVSGYVTDALRTRMKDALLDLEQEYGEVFKKWDGSMDDLKGVSDIITAFVESR